MSYLVAALLMTVVYLAVFFPYSYFRHDDWLILGNALVKMPEDWSRLWKPTLFYADLEVVWFFRPFFKGMTYLFFQLFHFSYTGWLVALLAILLFAIWCGAKTVLTLQGKGRSLFFIGAFVASWYLHFGSVVWMGEGMMNIPQVALLALNVLLFVQGAKDNSLIKLLLAISVYLLAIGFKESAVTQPALLFIILFFEPLFLREGLYRKVKLLSPYAVTTFVYLLWRFSLPANSGSYHAYLAPIAFIKPLVIFTFPMILLWVAGAALFTKGKWSEGKLRTAAYVGFFLLSISPYVGHGFFSPGWLVIPGFFGCLLLSCLLPIPDTMALSKLYRFSFGLTALSLIAVFTHLNYLKWWQWGEGGRTLKAMVERSSDTQQHWIIFDCPKPDSPDLRFERVVAFEAGMNFLWRMHHQSKALFAVLSCEQMASNIPRDAKKRFFKFTFPKLEELNAEDFTPQQASAPQEGHPIPPPGLHSLKPQPRYRWSSLEFRSPSS